MSAETRSPLLSTLCALWVIGFLIFFFSRTLPNNSDVARSDVWLLISDSLPSLLNPFDISHATAGGIESGWHLLPQRWPLFRLAGLLVLAAFLTGTALTRPLLHTAPLSGCERFVIRAGLGLSFQSLWTLIIGCAGLLTSTMVLAPGGVSAVWLILIFASSRFRRNTDITPRPAAPAAEPATRFMWIASTLVALPFVILLLLNACTPPFDFDVREYHLQGPKEWYLAGQISSLEHNVYTSFPFLSEMLSLDGMVLADDWNDGALVGKVVLAVFQLLTTVCVFACAQRWFGTSAALIAALAYLTTPWTLRISLIAYAEGAITYFLMASVMCGMIAAATTDASVRRRLVLTTGLLAGSAMAAKYPGVVSVVIPVGILLLWSTRRSRIARETVLTTGLLFGLGVLLTVGPWLIRNAADTGNPVYPLLYRVFGADDWSPAMDTKWKAAHSASEHSLTGIPDHLLSVMANNDWTSGLLFALAVPTLLTLRSSRQSRWLWLMLIWMLITWWALTHRIDRFWIPVIPVAAVLAGKAWTMFSGRLWHRLLVVCVGCCCLFNLQIWRSGLVGFQVGLMDLSAVRQMPVRADFRILNSTLSQDSRVLMVGEAEVFDLSIPVVYNTVFDESLFERWTADESDERRWSAERRMKSANDIRQTLHARGISHVYVNWLEILRYRRPGSYTYTDYVMPSRLRQLVDTGVLAPPVPLSRILWTDMSQQDRDLIEGWTGYEDLLTETSHGQPLKWTPVLLYKVAEQAAVPAESGTAGD